MMKASATILLATLLFAGAAEAQQRSRTDYSREAVQRFVMSTQVEEDEIRHEYDPLDVNFAAFGTTFRFGYLPQLMMPLAGSMVGTTQTWPDAFSLTRTQIATGPRAWRTQRAFRRELRDINKRLDATVKVETK
jgi:hypothetical protein